MRFTSTSGGFFDDLTRLQNLTISTELLGSGRIWYDSCTVQGSGPDDASMYYWIGINSRLEGNVYVTGRFKTVGRCHQPLYTIRGCSWHMFRSQQTLEEADIESNHYVDSASYGAIAPGEDVSVGDPQFVDPGNDDYTPDVGSPLRERISPLLVPVDAIGAERLGPGTIGAYV